MNNTQQLPSPLARPDVIEMLRAVFQSQDSNSSPNMSVAGCSSNRNGGGNRGTTGDENSSRVHVAVDKENQTNCNTFSPSELLKRKTKNQRSTKAQSYFLYTIRETAKQVGIYGKAPYMRDVPYATHEKFERKVLSALPQLAGCESQIKERLSRTLTNRRNQNNNVLKWKRTRKLKKWQEALKLKDREEEQQPVPAILNETTTTAEVVMDRVLADKEHLDVNLSDFESDSESSSEDEDEDEGFIFLPGDEVHIMDGGKMLGRASFIRVHPSNNDDAVLTMQGLYTRLSKNYKELVYTNGKGEIKLDDVKPGDKFIWTKNQLLMKAKKANIQPVQTPGEPPKAPAKAPTPPSQATKKVKAKKTPAKAPTAPQATKVPTSQAKKSPAEASKTQGQDKAPTCSSSQAKTTTNKKATNNTKAPQGPNKQRPGWKGYVEGDVQEKDVFSVQVLQPGAKRVRKERSITNI